MVNVFIVNPVAGTIDRTEIIQRELGYRSDIQYILFNTEEAGQERPLVKRILDIFDDEPVRVFICGGSGTLSNSIDAMEEQDFDHVEIGYYPCGTTNDFLKNFGDLSIGFDNLNAVIDGKPKYVDSSFIKEGCLPSEALVFCECLVLLTDIFIKHNSKYTRMF